MTDGKPRKSLGTRADYRHFLPITTRWLDNDLYGHINNTVYYSFFDTVVNTYLIEGGFLKLEGSEVIGLVVETGCRYARPLSYPHAVTAGLRVGHIGNSSVRYEIALFGGDDREASAEGFFIHVYVGRENRRPVPLPVALRQLLEPLLVSASV